MLVVSVHLNRSDFGANKVHIFETQLLLPCDWLKMR